MSWKPPLCLTLPVSRGGSPTLRCELEPAVGGRRFRVTILVSWQALDAESSAAHRRGAEKHALKPGAETEAVGRKARLWLERVDSFSPRCMPVAARAVAPWGQGLLCPGRSARARAEGYNG